jgi:ligand-binding SRPBCC domain-containing protein
MVDGMLHRFATSQWLPYPVPFVFAFLADPQNLPPLMPPWQKARVEEARIVAPPPAPPTSFKTARLRGPSAGAGSVITISFRPFPFSPIRLPWEAEISEFVWNDHFCDVQQRGPFARWKHCHYVKDECRDGVSGALITDDVTYEMKMGKAGELAHSIFMAGQVKSVFDYRQKRIAAIFARIGPAAAQLSR